MSTQELRVGVIGRGFGGRVVAPTFDQTEGCRVVDVVSPRDEAAVEDASPLGGRQLHEHLERQVRPEKRASVRVADEP